MKNYNKINWSDLLYYDESSVSGVKWKENRFNCSGSIIARKDADAGSLSDKGYWVVSHKSGYYKVHRIIWILNNGEISTNRRIDHKNRIRSDNKISNLQLVLDIKNRRNRSKSENNTSGSTGVRWASYIRSGITYTYVIAQWNEFIENKSTKKIKSFSVKKYGILEAYAMACEFRENKIRELNIAGYGYSETHGK